MTVGANRTIALILTAIVLYLFLVYFGIGIVIAFLYVLFALLSAPSIVVAYIEELLEFLSFFIVAGVIFWQKDRICSLLRTDSWFGASSRAKKMADESAEKEMTSKSE
ncbi:MAG: hypothetical protein OXD31_08985 [Chloroflexi bacterium]|nr:hypothetical protein [Chloroflexota bacterium]